METRACALEFSHEYQTKDRTRDSGCVAATSQADDVLSHRCWCTLLNAVMVVILLVPLVVLAMNGMLGSALTLMHKWTFYNAAHRDLHSLSDLVTSVIAEHPSSTAGRAFDAVVVLWGLLLAARVMVMMGSLFIMKRTSPKAVDTSIAPSKTATERELSDSTAPAVSKQHSTVRVSQISGYRTNPPLAQNVLDEWVQRSRAGYRQSRLSHQDTAWLMSQMRMIQDDIDAEPVKAISAACSRPHRRSFSQHRPQKFESELSRQQSPRSSMHCFGV
mmetsp:Transcript_32550/g.62526  ORF Transcript_32550/g.62526 Transcript_32550/m.62526 type:complete len:274 (-) Transcript_32550:505-1326(-)